MVVIGPPNGVHNVRSKTAANFDASLIGRSALQRASSVLRKCAAMMVSTTMPVEFGSCGTWRNRAVRVVLWRLWSTASFGMQRHLNAGADQPIDARLGLSERAHATSFGSCATNGIQIRFGIVDIGIAAGISRQGMISRN
jgi:hypothetical protein